MGKIRRVIFILIVFLLACFNAYSDSFTMRTEINSVSYGISDFGLGLFPIGTNFEYFSYFKAFDSLTYDMLFDVEMDFSVSSPWLSNYDYQTGMPWWADGYQGNHIDRGYFRISSQVYTYLQQGFGINPVSGSGALVNLRLGLTSRFTNYSERLNLTSNGPGSAIFGKDPFVSGDYIQAYPWLTGGEGQTWNNYITLASYWYFRQWNAPDQYDGAYLSISFEAGPPWLGNSILPDAVTSDFYRGNVYFEQYLTIFQINQDNGWNWLSLMLGHSNTLQYTWGDVIPEYRIQTDRLRGYLGDNIRLRLLGPQFYATDCYPYVQVNIYNNLYFGGVQNEITGDIRGVELRSGVGFEFHLRLFGFIHVRYQAGYDFVRGFSTAAPSWWQNAELGFYVSL